MVAHHHQLAQGRIPEARAETFIQGGPIQAVATDVFEQVAQRRPMSAPIRNSPT